MEFPSNEDPCTSNEPTEQFDFSAKDIEHLDQLRAKRLSGESKTYDLEDAKKVLTKSFEQ